jgi:hypothetical protein
MRGLLADVNVTAHAVYLRGLFESLGLRAILAEAHLVVATFSDLGIALDTDDRSLWACCQENGWVFFTDNRNDDGADSLKATLDECWRVGCLPVVTLADKSRFERDSRYRDRVAEHVAELLFGASRGQYRSYPRIYVPLSWH